MSCCGCCIQLDTPQSIKDEGNDYYDAGTDIFAEIFEDSSLSNAALMQSALWAVYRLRMIGSCDTEEWVQVMKDRLTIIGPKWDDIMTTAAQTTMTDMDADSYVRVIQRTAIEGTEGDVSTQSATGSDVNVVEDEDMPQTPIGTSDRYLSRRSTATTTPSTIRSTKYVPNTQDRETYNESQDIMAKTFAEMMREYPDILGGFAREFSDYFVSVIM